MPGSLEGTATKAAFELWFDVALETQMGGEVAFIFVVSRTCWALPAMLVIQ